jgi:methionyl-tRNA formyltransferase
MTVETYMVAGSKPWSRAVFDEMICKLPGNWHFVSAPAELTLKSVRAVNPRYIFFLHWSWRVDEELVDAFECICFHMTDVPYGRGGSPLQNLIVRGYTQTKLTALRMMTELDAGPVYGKVDLCLSGSAEEIYIRASNLSASMISEILDKRPEPRPQTGEVELFHRRTPKESVIGESDCLKDLYDFIRMLDAEGYPRAYVSHHGYRYEFRGAALTDDRIEADVLITREEDE